MYQFSSIFSLFRSLAQAKTDVSEAKEESRSPFTSTRFKPKSRWQPLSTDKWGRPNTERIARIYGPNADKNGDGVVDLFTTPKREPSFVRNYTTNLRNTSINDKYANDPIRIRAHKGYSTGTIFSSGVSRIGQLTSLFEEAQNNPFGRLS